MKYDKEFLKAMSKAWKRGGDTGHIEADLDSFAALYVNMTEAALKKGFKRGALTAVAAIAGLAAYHAWKTGKIEFKAEKTEPAEEEETVEESE